MCNEADVAMTANVGIYMTTNVGIYMTTNVAVFITTVADYNATNVAVCNVRNVAGDDECSLRNFICSVFPGNMDVENFRAPPDFSDVPFFRISCLSGLLGTPKNPEKLEFAWIHTKIKT